MKLISTLAGIAALLTCSCVHHSHALKEAPEGHKPIFENNKVRVMKIALPPGGKIPLHNHDLPGVIIVHASAENLIRNAKGEVVSKGAPPEGAVWAKANGPHYSIENIDKKSMMLYRVEVK